MTSTGAPDSASVPARPGAEHARFCPRYQAAVELIGRRWTGAILRVLFEGPARYHIIVHGVPGLSDRLLAERLRELETAGVVARRVLSGPPVAVEYILTEAGAELQPVLDALGDWAHRWVPSAGDAAPGQ